VGEPDFRPRINHVAISVAPTVLDEQGRADILAFYGDVFGWTEGDNTGESGNPLILYTGAPAEFVYLLPAEPPLTPGHLDHFGLQVATLPELESILDRARGFADRDDRVSIVDPKARTTHGPTDDYTLTSAYLQFLLPLWVELQHLERHSRA
jgi:catechol 2,3-dioxygenase-like lactoylglutathione lyase family enzyme